MRKFLDSIFAPSDDDDEDEEEEEEEEDEEGGLNELRATLLPPKTPDEEDREAEHALVQQLDAFLYTHIGRRVRFRTDLYFGLTPVDGGAVWLMDVSHPLCEVLIQHTVHTGEDAPVDVYAIRGRKTIYAYRAETIRWWIEYANELVAEDNGAALEDVRQVDIVVEH